jgi:hypothetical protein
LQQVRLSNVFATAFRFIYAHLRVAAPIAGLPEVVRGDEPESAQSGNENSSAVKGNWSHALLLEMPVMVCEHKTHKHTQKLVFRQVCFYAMQHFFAAFIAMISSLLSGASSRRPLLSSYASSGHSLQGA